MAKDRTNKSRFPSNYGGGWIAPAQYLTECLCVLIAKQEKRALLDQFWRNEPWTSVFRRQTPLAVKLLQEYDVNVILAALRDRRCWRIQSFGARWLLDPILKEKQREASAVAAQSTNKEMEKTSTVGKPRKKKMGGNSLLTLLKNL
jgi:hypothetical protein